MTRLSRPFALAAVAVALSAVSAHADVPSPAATGRMGHGRPLARLQRCVSALDLSADQKSTIEAIFAAGKSVMRTDVQAVRADRDKLRTDVSGGADKSVLGSDVLAQHTDAEKLHADANAIRGQVIAKLSSEQQTTLTGCLDASGPGRFSGSGTGR
jgi:Spy/CpxP family protein refolding chaperone